MDKYEAKETLGDFLEGIAVDNDSKELVLSVLRGSIPTKDGLQRYYIDLDTLLLDDIDLSEAIWSLGEKESYKGSLSEIVFFDQLGDLETLRSDVHSHKEGIARWRQLELKVLDQLVGLSS